ncbi:LysR substrate-binding domain-containing protein [Gordonia jinhuaensis]|uniref:LysR family transcriptional regulator n=1 Tax=Gordonia jinhuaensis TaxID=1517702 RepID=A0A916TAX8_9ACTN|nr:LysR substrate-binding domain-containing protein [Gordonia jinhuaensis]GGB38261.1 LysR family transcriptional regulator [Gordonia jinhuaensis]
MISPLSEQIKLRHISCFVTVARHRHIGRAATELHLTQPAVSKTLSELESIVGVRLLDRGRHGANLTGAGEQFLRGALEVSDTLVRLDETARTLASGATPGATLRIGALPTVATGILPRALATFGSDHPDTVVTVVTDTNAVLSAALAAGDYHCVVGRLPDPSSGGANGLMFELLYAEPLAVVVRAGHELAEHTPLSIRDAAAYPVIVSPESTVPRAHAENLFRAAGIAIPDRRVETLTVSVARALTVNSETVWLIPERTIADDVAAGALVRLPIDTTGSAEPVGILRAARRTPRPDPAEPLVAEFIDVLREQVGTDQTIRR